ncbi:MAG: patatin-like phospholipase family protein [Gemmatimonadota bacterium]
MAKIALVLSGGSSLGAYIGGAVTEVFLALRRNAADDRVTIDVITGTSAGALTAGILARTLVVNPHTLPWIRTAWVDAVDARALLDPTRANRLGGLDASVVEDLTEALITAEPASDDHVSPVAGDPLRVGLTLAGLDGIRYDAPIGFRNEPGRHYGTRVFADSIAFDLTRGTGAGDRVWESLRQAALASSAFPFAFPPRGIVRFPGDYPGARLPPGSDDGFLRWYADGGLFDNAPVGLAKHLVERDPGYRGEDWRYVLVEPTMRAGADDVPAAEREPRSVSDLGARLAGAVLGQSAAKDWARARDVNRRLAILRALVEQLPDLQDRLEDPEAVGLGRQIGNLAERVAEIVVNEAGPIDGAELEEAALDRLESAVDRIESDPSYATAFGRLETRAGRARLAKLIFVLESVGKLSEKADMPLYLVAPRTSGELAGSCLGNFGGFLRREWRESDFRAGRRDARRLLEGPLGDIIRYEPDEDEAYEPAAGTPSWEDVPPDTRRQLERALAAEADRLLEEVRSGPVAALFGWAWKPAVRRWIVGRALEALRESC